MINNNNNNISFFLEKTINKKMNFVNALNKSIHGIFSQKETRPKISFLKICYIKYDDNKNLLSIILVCEDYIKIYFMQYEPMIEFKLIYNERFNYDILDIKPINYFSDDKDFEKPIISIISNSKIYFDNYLRFYSLKTKKLIHSIQFKYNINHSDFGKKYFGIGCKNGKIYIFENNSCNKIFKISFDKIIQINENNFNKNLPSNSTTISMMIDNKNNISSFTDDNKFIKNLNPIQSVLIDNHYFNQNKKNKNENKYQNSYYNTFFDISDNILCYFISKEENYQNIEKEDKESNLSTFENIVIEAYNKLSNLKDWSLKNFQNIKNLRKSTNVKSNLDILDSKKSNLNISIFNISKSREKIIKNFLSEKLAIPFFKKIGLIKQIKNGKFIIIGNSHYQIFYIFELYSQTNSKYNYESRNIKYKLIYSVFRGIRNCKFTNFEMSFNNEFCTITSNRGTTHLYNFPLRDNQIIENFENNNINENKNKQSEEYLNMKIINGIEIFKVKKEHYNNFNNCLFYSKIIQIDKINLDKCNFNENEIDLINDITKDKFMSYIKNKNYLIVLNDNIVYLYLIYNINTIIPLKTIKLKLDLDKDSIIHNINNISKNLYLNTIKQLDMKKKNINLDINTTNLFNFSIFQLNPMFNFNVYSNINISFDKNNGIIEEKNIEINYNSKENKTEILNYSKDKINLLNDEIDLYESIIKEDDCISIKKLNEIKENNNNERMSQNKLIINPKYGDPMSSIDLKNNFYYDKDGILENNIKNAIESNINDVVDNRNSVNLKETLVIKDNYYK